MDRRVLLAHYRAIADDSPLPLVIYNMPANTAGVDLDAVTISTLAEHANIIGVKDSAGNMAKLAQIVETTRTEGDASVPTRGHATPLRESFRKSDFSALCWERGVSAARAGRRAAAARQYLPREVCREGNSIEGG
jgi:hypothetical protein